MGIRLRAGSVWPAVWPWVCAGTVVVAFVMLKDVGGLLGSVQRVGAHAYDASVLSKFRLNVFDTTELADAIGVWRDSGYAKINRLVRAHLLVDMFLFIPALTAALWAMLRKVCADGRFAIGATLTYFVFDELETLVTYLVVLPLEGNHPSSSWLVIIQCLSLLKWAAFLTAALSLLVAWMSRGGVSAPAFADALGSSRRGGTQHPGLALSGLLVLVGVFTAVVALPGSGPLAQLPDVIRNHFTGGSWPRWAMSTAGLLLFAAATVVAGLWATGGRRSEAGEEPLSNKKVLGAAFVFSAVIFLLARWADGEFRVAAWSALFVTGGLAVAAWLGKQAGVEVAQPNLADETLPHDVREGWIGILVGVVILAGSVGLVRAAFAPALLSFESGVLPWWLITLGGVIGATGGAALARALVTKLLAIGRERELRRIFAIVTVVLVVTSAVWLTLSPNAGVDWGSNGVLALGFAWWALFVGALSWVSRTKGRWDVTRQLGFGARTPWLTLVVVIWVLAGVLLKQGGYHDATLMDAEIEHSTRYTDLDDALEDWAAAGAAACPERPAGEPVPLVLIAAPGGGIRAAYWTASALERVFDSPCASSRLFAVSGVSGGSVGAVAWAQAASQDVSAEATVKEMASDTSLPAVLAGLLFRDIPQPVTAINTMWDGRAALLEKGWIDTAGVFGDVENPVAWSDTGEGLPFVPVLALNGSSVTDPCRVVVSNVGELPSADESDCQTAPTATSLRAGPVGGAIDPFPGLHGRDEGDRCGERDVPAVTAALLSARFPVVTTSGGLLRCVDGEPRETFVVDGGYYENSGLLTVLQIWEGIEGHVREHNRSLLAGRAGSLGANPIQPWIVVADNHYIPEANTAPPATPYELLVPLTTKAKSILTQPMLEQAAAWEMSQGWPEGPGFARLAPSVRPAVEAPLGWVLSSVSTDDLDDELQQQLGNDAIVTLREQLEP